MHNRCRFALAAALFLAVAPAPAALGAEETAKEPVKVGYDKGFYIKTDNFSLTLGGRVQFRFTQFDLDGADENIDDLGSFTVSRLRLTLGGHFYKPTIHYYIQYDLRGENVVNAVTVDDADASGDLQEDEIDTVTRRGADLRDAYIDLTQYRLAQLRVGQFKPPFGNQEMTSSGAQQFVERSFASLVFAPLRDQGLMLFGRNESKKFGYMTAVVNGNGRNRLLNDNEGFRYVARVNFDPNGEYKLEETAVDHPEKVNWTIGAAWTLSANDAAADEDETSMNYFFGLKYKPFSVSAEWYDRRRDLASGKVDADGTILQTGLFVVPGKVEIAVRRSEVDPDTDIDNDELEESRVGLNWYWLKHNYKLQLDYGIITFKPGNPLIASRPNLPAGEDADDKEFRAQLQFRF